jgi:hypothetical protein
MKINLKNTTEIQAAINTANGRSTAHTFTSAAEILQRGEVAEQQLIDLGLIKSLRPGAVAVASSGGNVARAYKYSRITSKIKLLRCSSTWFLTEISNSETYATARGDTFVALTVAQDAAITALFRLRYARANEFNYDSVKALRNAGYAVTLWNPDELRGADAKRVEDSIIDAGWEIIGGAK